MKSAMAATAFTVALTATALAQLPQAPAPTGRSPATPPVPTRSLPQAVAPSAATAPPARISPPFGNLNAAAPGKVDPQVGRASTAPQDDSRSAPKAKGGDAPKAKGAGSDEQPMITLPPEPIEPYLLTSAQGPFMILAYSFRSPYAAKYAQALAMELRARENLPAYVFYMRIQPGGSNVRNVPPTAPNYIPSGEMSAPEAYRKYDEAVVLVGNYPTIDDAERDLKRVKKIRPESFDSSNSIWSSADPRARRQGLSRAIVTQNPLVAVQRLYPGAKEIPMTPGGAFDPFVMAAAATAVRKPDPMVKRMNQGPRSLLNCPGTYTMVVSEFGGRISLNPIDPRFRDDRALKESPLQTAHEDAENLGEVLAKSEVIRQSGQKVYVYHDRSSSKVCVGSFQSKDDPAANALRELILQKVDLFKTKDGNLSLAKLEMKPASIQKYVSGKGEFFKLQPSPTLLPVPKD